VDGVDEMMSTYDDVFVVIFYVYSRQIALLTVVVGPLKCTRW
jgi:hypothetical protein